jgi:hypothetical protein
VPLRCPIRTSRTISPDQCEKILLERLGNRTEDLCISSRPPYPLGHCSDPVLWPPTRTLLCRVHARVSGTSHAYIHCEYVTVNGRYVGQRLHTRVDSGSSRASGHVGSCIARRPAFSHGARPRPAPSRAARRRSRSPPPHPSRWRCECPIIHGLRPRGPTLSRVCWARPFISVHGRVDWPLAAPLRGRRLPVLGNQGVGRGWEP